MPETPQAESPNPEAEQALQDAERCFRSGDLDRAARILGEVRKSDPENFHAALGLGIIHGTRGELDAAAALLQAAVALRPGDADALFNLAKAQELLGERDTAAATYRRALDADPDQEASHVNLAILLAEAGDLEAAVDHNRRALEINPESSETHANLGNALRRQGALEAAVASHRRALELDPANAAALNGLGNALRDQGQLQAALASFDEALALNPGYAEALNNRGNALKEAGDWDAAVKSYRDALAIDPGQREVHYGLATVYYESGNLADAIEHFEKAAIKDSPEQLLRCLYKLEQFDAFGERLAAVSREKPTSALVSSLSAHAAVNLGRRDDYTFCPRPLDFVYRNRLEGLFADGGRLMDRLLADVRDDAVDTRAQATLKYGEQSSGDLFKYPAASFASLAELIWSECGRYRARFEGADCLLISRWPEKATLTGWYVRMRSGGHLDPHIHELGWVSGVIYLAMPGNLSDDEGRIAFSLHGDNYPLKGGDFATEIQPIERGDIVLFPSSLFHRTVPFVSDEERICIAFDVMADD